MKSTLLLTLMPVLLMASSANATTAAVTLKDCDKKINAHKPFVLILNPDDDLRDSISQCAKAAKLKGAMVNGLGQVHNPTLAYFTSNPKDKPTLTTFAGYYELASMIGNVSRVDNKYYTHIHAVLADKQFHGIAGHVEQAKVGLTVEVSLTPLDKPLQRPLDEKSNFGPIQP